MTDPFDTELELLLGQASGAYPDANLAHEAVRRRVRRIRRRRAMVASSATCLVLVGAVALAVRGGADERLSPADSADTTAAVATTKASETSTMESWPADTMAPDVTTDSTTMGTDSVGAGSPGAVGSNSGSHTSGQSASGHGGSRATTTTSSVPQVQPSVPAIQVQSFPSKGGTVSVQVVDRQMLLVAADPAPGFTVHITEASGDRIRVEFAGTRTTVEIQLEYSDGKVTASYQSKGV